MQKNDLGKAVGGGIFGACVLGAMWLIERSYNNNAHDVDMRARAQNIRDQDAIIRDLRSTNARLEADIATQADQLAMDKELLQQARRTTARSAEEARTLGSLIVKLERNIAEAEANQNTRKFGY